MMVKLNCLFRESLITVASLLLFMLGPSFDLSLEKINVFWQVNKCLYICKDSLLEKSKVAFPFFVVSGDCT